MNLVWRSTLQPLHTDVIEHFVLKKLLGGQAELVVELEHCLQHLNYFWGAFREAAAQRGSLPLRAHLLGVLNSCIVGKERQIFLSDLSAEAVKDLDKLVILTNSGGFRVGSGFVFVLVARRDWEAAVAWEKDSFLDFSSTLLDIGICKGKALSEHAAGAPDVRLGSVVALGQDELWRAVPARCNVR